MSKYTTEIRFICESSIGLSESKGYNDVEEIISKSRTKIFDFKYPIFDEAYRSVLETKILRHFYTREICAETVGLWKLWLSARMNEIMPYYNKLYESELLKFNPLYDVDYWDKRDDVLKGKAEEVGKVTDKNKNDAWDYYSDTPQGGIDGLASHTYLTNATHDTTNGENVQDTNRNNNFNNVDDYLEHVYGKRGGLTYSKMLKEYRDTFLNIDMKIINELNDLFFNLW